MEPSNASNRKRSIKKVISIVPKLPPGLAGKVTEYYTNKRINTNKKFTLIKGSRITVTNTEIKHIIKVIKSLENRGILLKGITKKNY